MNRYKIPGYDYLLDNWSLARVYVAIDSMFWNGVKPVKDFGVIPCDVSEVKAGGIFAALGMWR